jgi:hypothetical protein
VARERCVTTELLAHLGEVEERRLHLPAGYPSLFAYCVGELHMSEDAALKRIRAARAARKHPAIFSAVADGRLHLAGVAVLAKHLTVDNAAELIAVATHKTRAEIEILIAQRFPSPDVPPRVQPIAPSTAPATDRRSDQLAPGPVFPTHTEQDSTQANMIPSHVVDPVPTEQRPRIAPLAPQRFAMQLTIGQGTHDKLRYAQQLLRHQNPSGELASVIDLALDALIAKLEKRKFGATDAPQSTTRPTKSARHVPNHVKRAVWKRDGGRCTFVGDAGKRCESRDFLEYDHVDPVARGGIATTDRIRLRCRAHNQYAAECAYGAAFMERKRHRDRTTANERPC